MRPTPALAVNDSKPVEIVLVPAERIMPFEPVVVELYKKKLERTAFNPLKGAAHG